MRSPFRAPTRALFTVAGTGVAVCIGLASGAWPASAHVHAEADNPAPGSTAVVTFRVPGESENNSLTTKLSVKLPDVASARTEAMPGWTATLDRDAATGAVRSVTWTADPKAGISSDQFALFRVSVKLPDGDSVSFPTTQTYSDGTVVAWDQGPLPDGGEPDHPVPALSLTDATASHGVSDVEMTARSAPTEQAADNTARWLAGGALTLAAVAVAAALVARRRT
ncbi:YcnI family protein [Mycobacterium sp. ITM-2016-00318]|uniref:YcnI family copper-binding membrane protein n=1 Tax=Mycobacterium sp. ITM-2016-00318 TaxID=2099693 RepID=UPI000CF8A560|nr:YcnI family protein [Mycobacterium sp. ITM-2016-00318]WNG92729.1 YcnI family protein [Mycobacterium sp. ITM-2016-00318]